MSIDQEERRQRLRDEVQRRVGARAKSATSFDTHDLVGLVFGMLIDMIADLWGRVEELERMLCTTGSEGPSRQNGRMGDMGEDQKEAAPEATSEGTDSQSSESKPADVAGTPEVAPAPAESGDSEPTKSEVGQDGDAKAD